MISEAIENLQQCLVLITGYRRLDFPEKLPQVSEPLSRRLETGGISLRSENFLF